MIWGYDTSARMLVDFVILVIVLSTVFIKRYIEQKNIKTKMRNLKIKQRSNSNL